MIKCLPHNRSTPENNFPLCFHTGTGNWGQDKLRYFANMVVKPCLNSCLLTPVQFSVVCITPSQLLEVLQMTFPFTLCLIAHISRKFKSHQMIKHLLLNIEWQFCSFDVTLLPNDLLAGKVIALSACLPPKDQVTLLKYRREIIQLINHRDTLVALN